MIFLIKTRLFLSFCVFFAENGYKKSPRLLQPRDESYTSAVPLLLAWFTMPTFGIGPFGRIRLFDNGEETRPDLRMLQSGCSRASRSFRPHCLAPPGSSLELRRKTFSLSLHLPFSCYGRDYRISSLLSSTNLSRKTKNSDLYLPDIACILQETPSNSNFFLHFSAFLPKITHLEGIKNSPPQG